MAIPFYENEEEAPQQQQPLQIAPEVDQVDGPPALSSQNANTTSYSSQFVQPQTITENDLEAWKILALAMCKALKDFYQQNMTHTSGQQASSTAVIQILPNGQVKPKWN